MAQKPLISPPVTDDKRLNRWTRQVSDRLNALVRVDKLEKTDIDTWVLNVGTVTNIATGTGLTGGPITTTGTISVATNGITNTLLADMATHTIKGNHTGSTGDPEDLTGTQVTALLDNFVGDSGTGGTKGLVLAPTAGDSAAGKFLAANGTWKLVTAGGAGGVSPLTTKGDIWAYAAADGRFPVGSDGQTIVADSAQSFGIKWAAPAVTPLASAVLFPPGMMTANSTSIVTQNSGDSYLFYLGKAQAAWTALAVRYRVTRAIATVTWAELAVYKGAPVIASAPTLTRVGYTDTSAVWTSTGQTTTSVTLSGVSAGDDLWVCFGNQATTTLQYRAASISDDLGTGVLQTGTFRPSTTSSPGSLSVGTQYAWVAAQGS